jgi:DNA-directed RNA polymerase sigma subunit (sigma70/sigma32)
MIAWKYLDKTGATIAAMRDYESMRAIINNTPDEIKDVYEKMSAPRSAKLTGLPSPRNPQAGEDKLAAQIDKLDLLRERYSSAVEYMAWFESAWGTLTDIEKHILKEYYMTDNQKSGAAARVECALGYCDRQIRRIKEKALERLSVLLFGK